MTSVTSICGFCPYGVPTNTMPRWINGTSAVRIVVSWPPWMVAVLVKIPVFPRLRRANLTCYQSGSRWQDNGGKMARRSNQLALPEEHRGVGSLALAVDFPSHKAATDVV